MSYYFISIGGSGAKTLEALTHLCAMGVMPSREELNILVIDPDAGNGNLDRSKTTLQSFDKFRSLEVGNDTLLFKTRVNMIISNPVNINQKLDDLMNVAQLRNTPLGSLYEVLYSEKERTTELNEGFRGHPSIGAAVLAKKYTLDNDGDADWANFVNNIKTETKTGNQVKIFLAGSVFGGTGAAGIPTISRLLRRELKGNDDRVSIGTVMILPYFTFDLEGGDNVGLFVRPENFLTNTKAALNYYAQRDNVFNAMYFVGDSKITQVNHFSPGASKQCNDAHIVDLYAALAAIDLYSHTVNAQPIFKHISHDNDDNFSWSDFPGLNDFRRRFVQFTRFICAYVHLIKPVLNDLRNGVLKRYQYPWYLDYFEGAQISDDEIRNFESYAASFMLWLRQLESLPNREIKLINQLMLQAGGNENIGFESCDGIGNDLNMNEVWNRLSEKIEFKLPVSGFGRFLRRLYDVCKV